MKKIGLFILCLCTILFAGNLSQAKDYEYTNLDITANILIDGTIDIKENFTADFFVSKHGIIRDIPLNYSVGGNDFHIEVSNINVQGKNYSTSKNNGNIEIKIGDADRTVIGEQNYPISYSTYGLIRNFSGMGYAELYWNLIGYDFDTNINKVKAELILPKTYTGFTADDFLVTTDGKSKTIDGFEGRIDWSKGNKIIITYDKTLPAYQGITLAIKFPNNYFEFDHNKQAELVGKSKVSYISTQNLTETVKSDLKTFGDEFGPFILFFIFIIISIMISKIITGISSNMRVNNLRNGGKLKGKFAKQFPVIVQYDSPKGINPAEAGLLLHRKASTLDLVSLIYYWLSKGLISIDPDIDDNKKISSIELKKLENIYSPKNISGYSDYEIDFFSEVFDNGDTRQLGGSRYVNRINGSTFLKELEDFGINKGRLKRRNIITKILLRILFILLFITSLIGFAVLVSLQRVEAVPFFFIAMFGLIFYAIYISSKTKKLKLTENGAKLVSHIVGYREFLKSCDIEQLKKFLEDDPLYFNKILPYAIIFGLESELLEKFKTLVQDFNMDISGYDGLLDSYALSNLNSTLDSSLRFTPSHSGDSRGSSYDSDSGWDSGSSFDSGGSSFDSGGGGGGGGGSSW